MAWEDRAHRLLGHCTATFGGDCVHAPENFPRQSFTGIWSDVYVTADPDTGLQVMTSDPNIGVRLADFSRPPKKNDQIIRRDVYYFIRAIEPDGEGGATLVLEKVKP